MRRLAVVVGSDEGSGLGLAASVEALGWRVWTPHGRGGVESLGVTAVQLADALHHADAVVSDGCPMWGAVVGPTAVMLGLPWLSWEDVAGVTVAAL